MGTNITKGAPPGRYADVYPGGHEIKCDGLKRCLAEALADLIHPIRPLEVGTRINSAFNLIERVLADWADVLDAEYDRGYANGLARRTAQERLDGEEAAYTLGKAAGIAEANERWLAAEEADPVRGR